MPGNFLPCHDKSKKRMKLDASKPLKKPKIATHTYIDATHPNTIHLFPTSQVKHGQGDYSGSLVAVGGFTTDVTRGILSGTHHQDVDFVGQ
jgi:hypothetical protein